MSKLRERWNFSLNQKYPLHSAATTGNRELFDHLVRQGYNLTDKDENGDTPLHCAASEGRLEIVQYIAKQKYCNATLLNQLNLKGVTSLAVACAEGHLFCVAALLRTKRCKVNIKNEQSSALHEAVASDNVDCVEVLIRSRCKINKVNEYGETPLHVALRALRITREPDVLTLETIECIKLIIDLGKADVDATFNQSTPLHFAAAAHCEGLVKYLLDFGADTTVRNLHGCKAIDFLDEDDPLYNMIKEAEEIFNARQFFNDYFSVESDWMYEEGQPVTPEADPAHTASLDDVVDDHNTTTDNCEETDDVPEVPPPSRETDSSPEPNVEWIELELTNDQPANYRSRMDTLLWDINMLWDSE